MNHYVVIGTYPTRNKRAFVVIADNYSKAIQQLLTEEQDNFINVEVVDTYEELTLIGATELKLSCDNHATKSFIKTGTNV